jgi:hypothetical protein
MLGIISEDQLNKEISQLEKSNIDSGESKLGRGKGNIETPNVLRKVIAAEVIEGGNVKEVSEAFSISRSSISAYLKGVNSTTDYNSLDKINQSLVNNNSKTKEKIVRLTRRTLRNAVRNITDEKLAAAKPGELAMVARNMSAIANDLEPQVEVSETRKVVVTYRPRIRPEEDFQILQVSE